MSFYGITMLSSDRQGNVRPYTEQGMVATKTVATKTVATKTVATKTVAITKRVVDYADNMVPKMVVIRSTAMVVMTTTLTIPTKVRMIL